MLDLTRAARNISLEVFPGLGAGWDCTEGPGTQRKVPRNEVGLLQNSLGMLNSFQVYTTRLWRSIMAYVFIDARLTEEAGQKCGLPP